MAERAVEPAPNGLIQTIVENLGRVVHAPDETLRLIVLCLVAEGHAIIEDFPGVGKTMLAKALARSLDCHFSRLQFTPDLLPSDVTGVNVFNQRQNEFEFRPGPVFANLLLVDEVNRASPKTQAALLECMERTAGVGRRGHVSARAAVHGHGHAEPDRVRGHVSAAGGAARPLLRCGSRSATRRSRRRRGCSTSRRAGALEGAAGIGRRPAGRPWRLRRSGRRSSPSSRLPLRPTCSGWSKRRGACTSRRASGATSSHSCGRRAATSASTSARARGRDRAAARGEGAGGARRTRLRHSRRREGGRGPGAGASADPRAGSRSGGPRSG